MAPKSSEVGGEDNAAAGRTHARRPLAPRKVPGPDMFSQGQIARDRAS